MQRYNGFPAEKKCKGSVIAAEYRCFFLHYFTEY